MRLYSFWTFLPYFSDRLARRATRTVFARDRKTKTKIPKILCKQFYESSKRSIFEIFVPVEGSRAKTVRVARRAR